MPSSQSQKLFPVNWWKAWASPTIKAVRRTAFWILLILFVALRLVGLGNPLSEQASWRQADTAAMARNLLQNFSFLPQLDYDGPGPNTSQLEFPFLPMVAALVWKVFGVADWSARLVALAFSMLSFLFLWRLAARTLGRRAAIIAGLVYAITPFNVFYNRTVMPEPVLLAFSLMALDAFVRYLDQGGNGNAAWAALSILAATLSKPNFLFFGLAFVVLLISRKGWRGFLDGRLWLIAVVGLLPALLYYQWANLQANQHFLTGLLEKRMLPTFLETLFSPAFWSFLPVRLAERVCSWPGLVLFFLFTLAALFSRHARYLAFATLGCLLLFIFVSLPIQYEHDYYHLLLVPIFALTLGWGLAAISRAKAGSFSLEPLGVGLTVGLAVVIVSSGLAGVGRFWQADPAPLRLGQLIRTYTEPNDLLLVDQLNPIYFYYADRKAWRVPPSDLTPTLLQERQREGATCLVLVSVEGRRAFPSPEMSGHVWLDGVDGKLVQLK